MENKSGIYCFENIINNKKYVGQAMSVKYRIRKHMSQLRGGYDECIALQHGWNKHGENCFMIYPLEYCPTELLDDREIFWIKELNSYISGNGYNISFGGSSGMKDRKHTEETRKKISNSLIVIWENVSEETRKNFSESRIGVKHTDESKKKISLGNKGKIITEETRKKISESRKGKATKPKDPEGRNRKISESLRGSKSPRAKISENQALQIKKMLNDNIKLCEISKILNISINIISAIHLGKSWRHINVI